MLQQVILQLVLLKMPINAYRIARKGPKKFDGYKHMPTS